MHLCAFLLACQPNSENDNYVSFWRHGYLSLVGVVCCQEEGFRRADPSSRGVLLCVFVCVCVWYVCQRV